MATVNGGLTTAAPTTTTTVPPTTQGGRQLLLARKINTGAGSSQRFPNTYQLQPSNEYAFSAHREEVREVIKSIVKGILKEAETSSAQEALMNGLAKIKHEVLQLQVSSFPRHRVVVHGVVGTIGVNQPTMIYGSQCLASPECGDDGVSVSAKNFDRYAAVSVYGSYQC